MSSRKLDELATDVDDASTLVAELQDLRNVDASEVDASEKLGELQSTLEDASNTLDDLENEDE